jgi:hypothetical protein
MVSIDETGQYNMPGEVDDLVSVLRQALSSSYGFDEAVANEHFPVRNFTARIVYRDEHTRIVDQQCAHRLVPAGSIRSSNERSGVLPAP